MEVSDRHPEDLGQKMVWSSIGLNIWNIAVLEGTLVAVAIKKLNMR